MFTRLLRFGLLAVSCSMLLGAKGGCGTAVVQGPQKLCQDSGGTWDDSKSDTSCWAPACGEALGAACTLDPTKEREAVCKCPADKPFWKDGYGCWSEAECNKTCQGTPNACSGIGESGCSAQSGCKREQCYQSKTCTGTTHHPKTCTKTGSCYKAETCSKTDTCYQSKTCTKTSTCYKSKTCTRTGTCYKDKTCYSESKGYYDCGYYYSCSESYDCGGYESCQESYDCGYYYSCTKSYDCGYYYSCEKDYDCGYDTTYTYDCSYYYDCGGCEGTATACDTFKGPTECATQGGCLWQ